MGFLMVDVIAWPPVGTVGVDNTIDAPISRSVSLLDGRRYVGSAQRSRRVATLQVGGIGSDKAGAGYVEMFKRQLAGGINLTRVALCAPVWYGALRGLTGKRGIQPLSWAAGHDTLNWTDGAGGMTFAVGQTVAGVAGTFGGAAILTCTDLPANTVIAYPSEVVRVTDATNVTHTARVLRVAKSDATGVAVLFLDGSLPSGDVLIGYRESVVYEVLDVNSIRALQPVRGNFTYTFNLREVFEEETTGFFEVNPWR